MRQNRVHGQPSSQGIAADMGVLVLRGDFRAKHAAHFKQVGGIGIIGLGSDFDGIGGKLEMDDCSKLPLLAEALRREGFTEDEVEDIFYRNARRFFEENL